MDPRRHPVTAPGARTSTGRAGGRGRRGPAARGAPVLFGTPGARALLGPGQAARGAALAVIALSVACVLTRVGLVEHRGASSSDFVAAILAALLFVPLHVWHLRFGLVSRRPPYARATFAAMVAIHAAALVVVGPAWVSLLGLLATSALIVLRPIPAVAVLAACAVSPAVMGPLGGAFTNTNALNLGYVVVMFAVVEFALVWLIAAAHQLRTTRQALVTAAEQQEAARIRDDVRAALDLELHEMRDAARCGREAVDGPGASATLVALDRLVERSASALAHLREIVAFERRPDRRVAAEDLARVVRDAGTPVGVALEVRRARLICAAVHAVVLPFVLLADLGVFGPVAGVSLPVLVGCWSVIAALQVSLAVDAARGRRTPHAEWRWLAMLVAAVVGRDGGGPLWPLICFVVAGGAAVALRGVPRILAVAAVLGAGSADAVRNLAEIEAGAPSGYLALNAVDFVVVGLLWGGGLFASARLVAITERLTRARDELGALAALATRQRMSRDLHDVLGQSLTAIGLKGDLARRLLADDRDAARVELDDLVALADAQSAEIEAIARGEREALLETETEEAVRLLRAAGIDVHTALELDGLDDRTGALLGWAVREGSTNVLRHSNARRVEIRAARGDGRVLLEIVNDGALAPRDAAGSGLAGLADRVAGAQGSAEGVRLDGHRFRLRVELPA